MRLVAWNCAMALHRKFEALQALKPDVAVIAECAEPARLAERLDLSGLSSSPVWVGENPNKGLAVFGFNDHRVALAPIHRPRLRFLAPVTVEGAATFNLLAVWAQNFSGGIRRKRQHGPLRLGLTFFTIGSRLIPAAEAALISVLETPLAPLWVWLAFDEKVSPQVLIGGGVVMVAVIGHVLLQGRLRRPLSRPLASGG